ncbi:MAG: CBS domain-containing protein, partial [Haloferacaceae archaeon]
SRPYASATRIAGRIGVVFAILFAVVGVLSFNVILLLLALFVYGAATTESRSVLLDELLEGFTIGDVMTRDPGTIPATATVDDLGEKMLQERRTVFPVTDASGAVVGVVTLRDLRRARGPDRGTVEIGDLMHEVPRLDVSADAFETLATLGASGLDAILVESDGDVVGVLSEEDFTHALTIRREHGPGVTW